MKKCLAIVLLIVVVSCQKAQRDEDTAVNTCQDIALAQTIFGDAYKQVRIAALNTQGISSSGTTLTTIYGCEEIKSDTLSNPKTITIDYKYIGCQGLSIDRYGRLLADFQGEFGKEGSAVDITFSNYFYQEYEVSGKIRVIFKERNPDDQEVHSMYVQSGLIYDGSTTLTWTASQTWTVEAKNSKPENFYIKGNSNGINRKGNTFKSEIQNTKDDLLSENAMSEDCIYVKRGKRRVEIQNLSIRSLRFGSGECDAQAEVIINGSTYNVSVP